MSLTGSDTTGNGTLGRPFQSAAKALTAIADGDTLIFRGGTYQHPSGLVIRNSNITIQAYKAPDGSIEPVTLVAPSNGSEYSNIRFLWGNNGKVLNLNLKGGYYGVKFDPATGPGLVQGCKIFDTFGDRVKLAADSWGQANDIQVLNNELFSTPGFISSPNSQGIDNVKGDRMIARGNYVHDLNDIGIYAKGGAKGCVIENNRIVNTMIGIILGQSTDSYLFDTKANPNYYENIDGIVRNNLIVNTTGAGIAAWAALNPKIFNNTLINVGQTMQAGILVNSQEEPAGLVPSTNVSLANNIIVMNAETSRPMVNIRQGALSG